MKLENQVCSPEQGKRLMELGITARSLFYQGVWKSAEGDQIFYGQECDKGYYHEFDGRVETFDHPNMYPAFTVAELGVMLPLRCISVRQVMDDSFACLHMNKNNNDVDYKYGIKAANTEAQARAAMLVYLLENNIITAAECNERLNAA